jgi:hypothetical protein
MVDKSKLAIATSQIQNPIPFLIELFLNLLSQMITISTIKLTSQPVSYRTQKISGMNILGKPGISFGSITYRRKYTSVIRINYFFSLSSSAFAKRTGSLSLLIIVSQIIFLTTRG